MELSRRAVMAGLAAVGCPLTPSQAGQDGLAPPKPAAGRVERFDALVPRGARLRRLAGGYAWCEGPVWAPAFGGFVFSDVKANREHVIDPATGTVRTLREPSGFANGHAVDRAGRLVVCEHGGRRVSLTGKDGVNRMLVESYQGRRFNSPNDVAVKSDGTIWFTDPVFGLKSPAEGGGGRMELPGAFVYRFDPATGGIDAVAKEAGQPNGIAFSPDESVLYVSDTARSLEQGSNGHAILAYDVGADGKLSGRRVFAEIDPGVPDGFALDVKGNLFTSAGDGVHILSPEGEELGRIPTPRTAANLAFGGVHGSTLLICAMDTVYSMELATRGAAII
ncbi:SMP-30/gluconolactonase/LRE family protein [Azospirillum sp. SYSU D00513]|uniref:SMP-30/gluconolactonase/LRE family protein n=1 Tax=Azospirillum sp. SYSU D00513 TaxID=2812561 RepID=UPI001A97BFCB|nr:SMP-30/gluconolactonase/LRE family protein [Azospirillum sp. SYSU D00513]